MKVVDDDLRVEYLRGNVDSRLGRLDAGDGLDVIVLARAGPARLGIERAGEVLDIVPAVGAEVLAVDCRRADSDLLEDDLLRKGARDLIGGIPH